MQPTRRQLLQGVLAAAILPGCRRKTAPPPPPQVTSAWLDEPAVVHAWFDLPDDPRSRELSGISWDGPSGTLWAVQDELPRIVGLVPDARLERWTFGDVVTLQTPEPLDLEGIVATPDGFLVASEIGPKVLDVDRHGVVRREIVLPAHFGMARPNRSLESLTESPSGAHLFTTSEWTLACDGALPTKAAGSHVRILRVAPDGSHAEEHAYETDPVPMGGDYGVADLAALNDDELLVLERGWAAGYGNTARVYHVSVAQTDAVCTTAPTLADRPTLKKELVVDIAQLSASGLPPTRAVQPSALLDNYEGMALGPKLPSGRRSLILVTDDNNRRDQVARLLVLGIAL